MQRFRALILFVITLLLGCVSCTSWQEAKDVIAIADSIDQTEHVIWNDTAAFGQVIRQLDNPIGRLCMSSTLGKAYYYMGRNHSLSNHIAEAAECYIEADRLQIDDPIYRGRVNSCMGYICRQNNNDSLALIFYENSNRFFKESNNEWYYAQILLDQSESNINLHNYLVADSLLQIAQTYQLDSNYWARYLETKGLYFDKQQLFDSALVYFNQGLDYWQTEEDKLYSYLKLVQVYVDKHDLAQALPYAQIIVEQSNNPIYLVNAYYCLLLDAKRQQNVDLLSKYSHAREDANRLLNKSIRNYAEGMPKLEKHQQKPYPLRWVWISLSSFFVVCLVLAISVLIYRKSTINQLKTSGDEIAKLSIQVQDQQEEIHKLGKVHNNAKRLDKIRLKYPTPPNRWNEYSILKKDLEPYLHDWLMALGQLGLTNREKVFCAFIFIYPHLPMADVANYMNNTENAVRVLKTRISQKLGITSAELLDFLRGLTNNQ